MKYSIFLTVLACGASLSSCKTPGASEVKDIGVVNTQSATTKVLYSDQNMVYLKTCKPPLAPPLTRDCASDETPKYLELEYYIFKLPYDVGPYQRSEQGLSLVSKALKDAQSAVAGGNQSAVPTVDRLTPIKLNLEKILKLRLDLSNEQRDLTFYEYQDEFRRLLEPFGEKAPNVWKDVTTTALGAASNCTTDPARCTKQDTTTGLWWSKFQMSATWNDAWSRCQSLNHNGQTDWRLPTKEELFDAWKNGIRSAASANWITDSHMTGRWFWSGSSVSYYTTLAWYVYLASGLTDYGAKDDAGQVVCVR